MNNQIIVLRHGEALHNVISSAWQMGDENMLTLTERGFVQAGKAAHSLMSRMSLKEGDTLNVISSDLLRAQQTTEVVRHVLQNEHGVNARVLTGFGAARTGLREFYTVYDGSRPEGFEFHRFRDDPFSFDTYKFGYNHGEYAPYRIREMTRGRGNHNHVVAGAANGGYFGGFPKVRSPLHVVEDLRTVYHLAEQHLHTNQKLLIVGHHFTLNLLRVVFHYNKVVLGDTYPPNLYSALSLHAALEGRSSKDNGELSAREKFMRRALIQAMNMELGNADPTFVDEEILLTPCGESLGTLLREWVHLLKEE